MATSDRIAVLNRGRMVQAGRPAEIFDHPRTRFVAEFVGKANILAGRFDGENRMQIDGRLAVRVTRNPDQELTSGEASLCLRPHHIVLTADQSEAEALARQDYNLFSGVIQRRIYFGESADYTVDLAPHPFSLRVVGAPSRLYDRGQRIFALAHPEHCVVISND
jgi:ABC-type Fe3+/spermidine/putrescine transport system ATPase subunit